MQTLTWSRRKVADAFGRANGTTEHYTTAPDGKVYALRKSDDIYFLYIDGNMTQGRLFFETLKSGKQAIEGVVARTVGTV